VTRLHGLSKRVANRKYQRAGRHDAIGQEPPSWQVLNCGGDCSAESHNGSRKPKRSQVNVRSDHDTLAQLRPGVVRDARPSYQSRQHVAFVQHKDAWSLLDCPTGAAVRAGQRPTRSSGRRPRATTARLPRDGPNAKWLAVVVQVAAPAATPPSAPVRFRQTIGEPDPFSFFAWCGAPGSKRVMHG
jgi:hypothetical protein